MPANLFRIEMIPALHGDCLYVEYGRNAAPRRLLIDGGPIGAYKALSGRIDAMPAGDRRFELIVMTHVDTDHVEGLVRLFANKPLPVSTGDVWFNGWRHLEKAHGLLGGKQGEFLSALLTRRLPADRWNGAFGGEPVVVPKDGALPRKKLDGDMFLTLLSPSAAKLDTMKKAWKKDIDGAFSPGDLDRAWEALARRRAYVPGQGLLGNDHLLDDLLARQFAVDGAAANGSSIAFLAECGDKSCLFLADAHHKVVVASLRRLLAERHLDRLKVDAVKLAHHGSKGNLSPELLSLIDSPRFLVSTNGDIFEHPDDGTIAMIIKHSVRRPPRIHFNYTTARTRPWSDAGRQHDLDYVAVYNPDDEKPFVIAL